MCRDANPHLPPTLCHNTRVGSHPMKKEPAVILKWKYAAIPLLVAVMFACSGDSGGPRRFDGPGPVVLNVDITAASGQGAALEKTFHEVFYPAISSQAGFKFAHLFKKQGGDSGYVLTLAFESEDLRVLWVAKDLHQEAWGKMVEHFSGGEPGSIEALGIVDAPMSAE